MAGTWTNLGQQQFYDRQEGTAVIQIDTTVTPPTTQITVLGGGVYGAATAKNPQSGEHIDVTALSPTPSWTRTADMGFPRTNVNAVLLPDGTVFVVGGQRNGKWDPDPQPVLQAEIYDPRTNTFTVTPAMSHPRQYHSIAVLLPDGRVLTAGGVDSSPGVVERDLGSMEIFSPPYLDRGPRPVITASPANVAYGAAFDVTTSEPAQIEHAYVLRPRLRHAPHGRRPTVRQDPDRQSYGRCRHAPRASRREHRTSRLRHAVHRQRRRHPVHGHVRPRPVVSMPGQRCARCPHWRTASSETPPSRPPRQAQQCPRDNKVAARGRHWLERRLLYDVVGLAPWYQAFDVWGLMSERSCRSSRRRVAVSPPLVSQSMAFGVLLVVRRSGRSERRSSRVLHSAQAMNSACRGSRAQGYQPPGWPSTETFAMAT